MNCRRRPPNPNASLSTLNPVLNQLTGGWDRDCGLSRKVVLVGNSGVGKTALVLRFCSDTWHDGEYPSTIGGSYLAKRILVDDVPFTFQIWDTVGDPLYVSSLLRPASPPPAPLPQLFHSFKGHSQENSFCDPSSISPSLTPTTRPARSASGRWSRFTTAAQRPQSCAVIFAMFPAIMIWQRGKRSSGAYWKM